MSSITGSCPNLFIICGLVLSYLVGLVLGVVTSDMSGASTWQIIFLLPIIFILTQTYLLSKVFPYETPKYLAQNNREL
jgi:F0F1-type ATP synthase assembly protein I